VSAAASSFATPDGVTAALCDFARRLRWEEVPEEAREVARHCLLDFLGCALAGAQEPLCRIAREALVAGEGSREAGLLGRPERASLLTAALVNGAAGHALDFDDTHTAMNGHPSVPVWPALLALAERRAPSGRALLEAFVAGVELECRLGALLGGRHYAAGFHATGTLGSFGAAAACAHLLGLDRPAWLHALGLAGTQAAGLKSGFGSMAKPLHAGRAASAGLLAALLAAGGFTAQRAVIEEAQGFAATHAGGEPEPAALERLAGRFLVRDTLFKFHAACYLTHAAIQAALELRERARLDPARIEGVELRVSPTLRGVCDIPAPRTGLEGKFSLRATAAMALLGIDTADPASFDDSTMAAPALIALRDRVRVVPVEALPPTRAQVVVELRGERLEAAADTGLPAPDLRLQRERLLRKFRALALPVLGAPRSARLAELALGADELATSSPLLEACSTSATA